MMHWIRGHKSYSITQRKTLHPWLTHYLAQVCADAADEPLAVAGVRVTDAAAAQLRACWRAAAAADAAAGREPLYQGADGFMELVKQVGPANPCGGPAQCSWSCRHMLLWVRRMLP